MATEQPNSELTTPPEPNTPAPSHPPVRAPLPIDEADHKANQAELRAMLETFMQQHTDWVSQQFREVQEHLLAMQSSLDAAQQGRLQAEKTASELRAECEVLRARPTAEDLVHYHLWSWSLYRFCRERGEGPFESEEAAVEFGQDQMDKELAYRASVVDFAREQRGEVFGSASAFLARPGLELPSLVAQTMREIQRALVRRFHDKE